MEIIKLSDRPDIISLIRAVDPKYRKTKALVTTADAYTTPGPYWSGGSREYAYIVGDGPVRPVEGATAPPPFQEAQTTRVDLTPGMAVVVVGTFRGKKATAKVYLAKGGE